MANIDTPEDIYAYVGQALADAVAEPWSEIRLEIDAEGDSIGLTGDYTRVGGVVADLDVRKLGYTVSKALLNLRRITVSSAHKPWSRAVFSLKADGDFNLKYAYPEG